MSDVLAINGGTPVRTKPWQEANALGPEERKAIERVMDSGRLSAFQGAYKALLEAYSFLGGKEVRALEAMAKDMMGVRHVVSVNSATSGLYAAVGALGLGFGDEVIVSPYTMSACAVAPLVYGAIPVFADVDPETYGLDPASIRKNITPRTKAIIIVHQFGIPARMTEIMAIAKEHKLKVIEDCAQAWGATYEGKWVGTIGDIGVFSFNVHKTIQCGEGGLCVTNDEKIALRLQLIRNHGEAVVADVGEEKTPNMLGYNYRLTELQAAVAQEQLKKLPNLNAKRRTLVARLSTALAKHPFLAPPKDPAGRIGSYYVFPLRYDAAKNDGLARGDFAARLKAEGVPFAEGYMKPLYLLPIFQNKTAFKGGYPWNAPENKESKPSYGKGTCPVVEQLYEKEMLLNLFVCPPQTEADIDDMAKAVEKVATLTK